MYFARAFFAVLFIIGHLDAIQPQRSSSAVERPFTDEAIVRGVDFIPNQGDISPFGDGLAFVDLDDDGDADLVVLGAGNGIPGIYENDGKGFFVDRSMDSGIGSHLALSGVCAADYDNDGDLDLYLSRWNESNLLFRNEGSFRFRDVTAQAGVGDATRSSGCAWGDFDHDGYLELYVGNRGTPNNFYYNNGDGTFTDIAARMGVDLPTQSTFQPVFLDFDKDGDLDLYVANDRGTVDCNAYHNNLFENRDGKLGDTDQNGQLDLRDFVKLLKWRSGDLVGNLVPGREMFDFDGDSDIDAVDFKQFHDRFPRPLPDCNKNGIDDLSEIFFDPSKDKNQDGVPDDCKS